RKLARFVRSLPPKSFAAVVESPKPVPLIPKIKGKNNTG
ncbi:hypothetical protein A2U01_0102862, partial [Trifolium medium]|nr:hypothetical protein [Trifolium medium]